MAIKIDSNLGDILISNTVIARMVGAVATKCYGVVGMVARNKKDGIINLLKPSAMTKGINVSVVDGGMFIDISIMVEYGVNINVVCNSIINNVKYKLQQATGLEVNNVVVHVEGIRVDE